MPIQRLALRQYSVVGKRGFRLGWGCVVAIVAVVIGAFPFLLTPVRVAAALEASSDLDRLVVATIPGYKSLPAGSPDSLDASVFAELAGVEGADRVFFSRSFVSDDGTKFGLVYAFKASSGNIGEGGAARGAAKAFEKAGFRPTESLLTSKAVVTYVGTVESDEGPERVAVAAYGSATALYMVSAFGPDPQQALVELLQPQLAFAPAIEPDDSELVAYRVGEWLGRILLIALPVGIWLAVRARRKAAQSAGPPVVLSSAVHERLAAAPQIDPFRRATRESTYDAIVRQHAKLQGDRPPAAAVQKCLDEIVGEMANTGSARDWLNVGVSEGWRLGRAALGMHAQSYAYESRKRVPQERLDAVQSSYAVLARPGLPKATTGWLRDAVSDTARKLATHQPTAGSHEHPQSDYEALVWRGVALAFAEFDAFHEWEPPAPRRKRVTSA